VLFSAFEHQFPAGKNDGFLRCKQVKAGGYRLENVEGFLSDEPGKFTVPRFSLDAYSGKVVGSAGIEFGTLHPDSVGYWIQVAAQGVNSALLPSIETQKGGKPNFLKGDAEISAFAHFQGRGFNRESSTNLMGGLAITRIGRRVADNLLKFLDPDQMDPSIQTYRSYLKRGWGVRVFSFDIKDDFVYASITPTRPPITQLDMFILSRLIGLGKSINFGRVPLKFFLTEDAKKSP